MRTFVEILGGEAAQNFNKKSYPVLTLLCMILGGNASMSKDESKKKLVGPWRSLHAAVWLIGLAILFWTNWWWPGILVLIAISGIIEALIRRYAPNAVEAEEPAESPPAQTAPPPPLSVATLPASAASREHRLELLPSICPGCGGPIRGHEVKWTGVQSADCPYCGVNLPMGKGSVGESG
jgi:hypothetical protein